MKMSLKTKRTSGETAVLVTTAHKGVFFGYATDTNNKTIKLRNARNCIYWPTSVGGFVGLSTSGPNAETRIGPAAEEMTLHDVTAVLKCSEAAENAWLTANWKF